MTRLAFPSAVLCAVAALAAGCGTGVHSDPRSNERFETGESPSVAVVTTPTSDPTVHPGTKVTRVRGTNGNDRLLGTPGRDIINGLHGSDILRGGAGNDLLRDYTGVGTGVPVIDSTTDVFYGGPGDDLIYSSHHDGVHAGPGNDTIYADYLGPGDVISCGPGRDVVIENDDFSGIDLRGCEKLGVEYAG